MVGLFGGDGMCWIRIAGLAITVVLSASVLHAESSQKEGETLIERAKLLSNIRIDGAPAFKLDAKFTAEYQSSTVEGTYTETWISRERWQRKTVATNFQRVEMVEGRKRWTLVTGAWPERDFRKLESITDFTFYPSDYWKADKVEGRQLDGTEEQCILTKPEGLGGRAALCFDKNSGLLVERIYPRRLEDKIVDDACVFSDYAKFADKMFPRSVKCFLDRKQTLVARLELTAQPAQGVPFAVPEGAKEAAHCLGDTVAPKAIYFPDPAPPRRENPKNPVVLWMVIGVDGKPHDIKVARTVDKAFDNAAIEAVRQWRFRPATCEGQPVETQINVEVTFRVY